jgi:hypothetical protein
MYPPLKKGGNYILYRLYKSLYKRINTKGGKNITKSVPQYHKISSAISQNQFRNITKSVPQIYKKEKER